MINDKKVLAIIPARAGSRRLPNKNKKVLCGKPLISWSIHEAQKSRYIDKLIVTSDDKDILDIAEIHNATWIERPEKYSNDSAMPIDVIKHVLKNNHGYDIIVWLQPTSPLRITADIDSVIDGLERYENYKSIVSVNERYEHNGAVYAMYKKYISDIETCENCKVYVMPNKRSVDIDTEADFERAERLMSEVL